MVCMVDKRTGKSQRRASRTNEVSALEVRKVQTCRQEITSESTYFSAPAFEPFSLHLGLTFQVRTGRLTQGASMNMKKLTAFVLVLLLNSILAWSQASPGPVSKVQ